MTPPIIYLLCDFETTGTGEDAQPLEVCVQFLDQQYKPLADSFAALFPSPCHESPTWEPWAMREHTKNELLCEIRKEMKDGWIDSLEDEAKIFERNLFLLWQKHAPGTLLVLMGCSPHFDRRFLEMIAPDFCKHALSHRHFDISTVWQFARDLDALTQNDHGIVDNVNEGRPRVAHRATQDVRDELRLIQRYLAKFRLLAEEAKLFALHEKLKERETKDVTLSVGTCTLEPVNTEEDPGKVYMRRQQS